MRLFHRYFQTETYLEKLIPVYFGQRLRQFEDNFEKRLLIQGHQLNKKGGGFRERH